MVAAAGAGQRYTPPPADVRPVPMRASCTAEAAADIDRGAAWLLILSPAEARRAFERAADADPDCALAYWGQAVSRFPIADEPMPDSALAALRLAADRARAVPATTPFERAAVDALSRAVTREAAPGVPAAWPARFAAYRDALCPAATTANAAEAWRLFCARAHLLTSTLPGDRASLDARRLAEPGQPGAPLSPGAALIVLQPIDPPSGPPSGSLVDAAMTTLAALTAPSPAAHHVLLRAAVARGDWALATQAGERALQAAGADGVYALLLGASADYAPESLLEAYLQQGRTAAAIAFVTGARAALAGLDATDPRAGAVTLALARMDARLALTTRRWPDAVDAPATWVETFVVGLGEAIRAWPGGDPVRLARARSARDRLVGLADADRTPSEIAWAATLVDAAMAASQDEHPQMTLLFTHAVELEARLRSAGRLALPLVPARELAAELWLRTYRYADAQREARATLETHPRRALPHAIVARAAQRMKDVATASAAWRIVGDLRRSADADDPLRLEAAEALTR